MKAFLVYARISTLDCYMIAESRDRPPVMSARASDGSTTVTLFSTEDAARKAIDRLSYGTGKLAQIVAVTMEQPSADV